MPSLSPVTRLETGPRAVEFNSIKKLISRTTREASQRISTEDGDVPVWQRQSVWNVEDQGLLALSILQNYPIGLVILWRKGDGVRVPIDGRQRLTAIQAFVRGEVAIPDLPGVPEDLRHAKYVLRDGDDPKYKLLPLEQREDFDDYPPQIVEFEHIDETTAMDIFIKLQGGKALTKTEVRAALGGRLCEFVTDLTTAPIVIADGDEDEVEPGSHHPFFKQVNLRNVRKAHRNLCDVLLHEYLYPTKNKHWSSLESLYRDKAGTLTEREREGFRKSLNAFARACSIQMDDGKLKLLPQLRSAFLILTFYRAWREIETEYVRTSDSDFAATIQQFEGQREATPRSVPWVNFTSALSNAGYSEGRCNERHDIFMTYLLQRYPAMPARNAETRMFTEGQKIAIWSRASHQCEWEDGSGRCTERFDDFRNADADHIVRWIDGGLTTLENGRLLCQSHNRGRRDQ